MDLVLSSVPFPQGVAHDAFLRHPERLNGEVLPQVANQHGASKVILRGFAGKDRNGGDELIAFSLERGRAKPRGVSGCGRFEFLVPVGTGTIEALWKVTEDGLHDAIGTVVGGTFLSDPREQCLVRDAVALHYTRSVHSQRGHYQALRQTWLEQRQASIRALGEPLARHFYQTTGLHPVGNGALEYAYDRIATNGIEVLTEGWPFRTRIEDLFGRVRAWIAPTSLQILRSSKPLLIADAPGVATMDGRTRVGTGVGLFHADELILPLTRWCVARLSSDRSGETGYRDIGDDESDQLNRLQIANAYRHVYWHPADALGVFVQTNIGAWPRPASVESLKQDVLALQQR